MGLKKLLTQSIIWRCFYFFSVLLVNVFLSRYLEAAGTGSLYFTVVIFSFMQVALSLGGEAAVIYFASSDSIERKKLTTLSITWSFVAGLLVVSLISIYFLLIKKSGDLSPAWYAAYGFLYVCGQMLTNFIVGIYYTRENYFLPNFILAIVNLLFVVYLFFQTSGAGSSQVSWTILLFFATFFTGGILVYFSYIIRYKTDAPAGLPGKENITRILKYALTAMGANVIFFLVYKVDYFFVNYSPASTPAELGNYIQASKLGQMLLLIPQIIASVVFPKTASGEHSTSISNAIMIIARLFSQFFLAVFIGVAILGAWFFPAIFGNTFDKMEIPMLILIPGIFSLSILALLSAYFAGKNNLKVNLYGAIIGLSIMIIGDFIFVPLHGIIAAAIISTLSYSSNLGYAMWNFYRNYDVHWAEFFKWRKSDYNTLLSLLNINKSVG
ncbi:MAG: polysaccharide biosynthesis C-terminal domain-containing protein [Bacteroidetes bacterium]|nr:polysaccharide biosynthesis C-terminal domain-containing protein [Bacteroidota bacterium]